MSLNNNLLPHSSNLSATLTESITRLRKAHPRHELLRFAGPTTLNYEWPEELREEFVCRFNKNPDDKTPEGDVAVIWSYNNALAQAAVR